MSTRGLVLGVALAAALPSIGALGGCGGPSTPPLTYTCGTGTSGTLASGQTLTVAPGASDDLAGAAISAADHHVTPPAGTVTIACAPDLVPSGYVALGPAVAFGPAGASSDRPFTFTLPYKAARLPAGARDGQIEVFVKNAGGPVFAGNVEDLAFDEKDAYASRATFKSEQLATFQLGIRGDAGQQVSRHLTFRAIVGVSMGGSGAESLGFRHPDMFDTIGILGGEPGADVGFTLARLQQMLFGGFCTAADEAAGKGKVGQLCPGETPAPMADQWEIPSDYEHFVYQSGSGVGLTLNRQLYMRGLRDLSRAMGNPTLYNPADPYLPPGVPASWLTSPDPCGNPVILKNFYDARFNPDGSKDVITFCDGGDSPALGYGVFDPSQPQTDPPQVLLAVDVNGNHVRDSGEPVIAQLGEPFEDVGTDGLADKDEPGYDPVKNPDPDHDDYHFQKNPLGTEGDLRWEPGEPFTDSGLDGVMGKGCPAGSAPGCYDYGDGNGKYDLNPNVKAWLTHDAHTLYAAMTAAQRARLDVWIDAGVRDFFNAQVSADQLVASMHALGGVTRIYDGFQGLGRVANESQYEFIKVDYQNVGHTVLVRYGDPDASSAEIMLGDGRHVGTVNELIFRIYSVFDYIQSQWPGGDRTIGPPGGGQWEDDDRNLLDACDPSMPVTPCLQFTTSFGRVSPYGVFLPPGYFDPQNAGMRYPVIYFLHGYGMSPASLVSASDLFANYMLSPGVPENERLQKFIIVYVDGRCRPGGDVAGGTPVVGDMGDECEEGTFYTDDVQTMSSAQMERMFLELSARIDHDYRTRPAADIMVSPY